MAFLPGSARIKIEHRDIVFSDTASHWAKESISFVAARNIFTGYSDDRFLPDYYMNRSMLITVLYRLSDPYERNNTRLLQEGAFNDVNPNAYYSAAVIWGFDNNIISGIGQEQFMPEEPITRQELALILCNYAKYLGMDVSDIEGMSIRNYSDYENIAPWAINAFRWALNSGLMQGKTPEKLDPQGIATRGEVATILY
ncbi:MAG: S-layer homology domain-containing protein, partial [Clostridiales bacterium]